MSASASAPFKVIIVGGGLAGNILANGLLKHDVDVQVYERMEADGRREGYQIRLGENALVGMRACLAPDVLNAVLSKMGRAGGKLDSAPAVYTTGFKQLCDFSKMPGYPKSAPINRGLLRDIVARPVEQAGRMHYGKAFRSYEIVQGDDGERVRVHFEDDTSDICHVLIGADGSRSKINTTLGLNNIRALDHEVWFLVKSDLPTAKLLKLSPPLLQGPIATFTNGRSLFWATYLPDEMGPSNPEGGAQTKKEPAADESLSSCMLGMATPASETPEAIFTASIDEKWEFLRGQISHWSPYYLETLEAVRGEDIHVFVPRESKQPPLNWRAKVAEAGKPERGHCRVWLLGDSLHAMLPARGMGGNQAILDTAVMLPHLTRFAELSRTNPNGPSSSEIEAACIDCERAIIPRAFYWVRKSGMVLGGDTEKLVTRIVFSVLSVCTVFLHGFYTLAGLFVELESEVPPELRR